MSPSQTDNYVFLYAHTRLADFLRYMTRDTVAGESADRGSLANSWRTASARFHELQQTEAGWADRAVVNSLPKSLEPLVRQVAADAIFRRSFASVPGQIGLVELDRLVVSQKTINLSHVARLKEQVGSAKLGDCVPGVHAVRSPSAGGAGDANRKAHL